MKKKLSNQELADISFKLSTEISKNIEDYLFVN